MSSTIASSQQQHHHHHSGGDRSHNRPSSSSSSSHHHHHHHHNKNRPTTGSSSSSSSTRGASSSAPSSSQSTASSTSITISKEQLAKIEPFQLQKRKSAFQCPHLKFQSVLPEPKIETKVLNFSFDLKRFVPYKATTLEQNYKFLLLTEPDLGIPIDLINPNTYAKQSATNTKNMSNNNGHLDDEDRVLLGMEPLGQQKPSSMDNRRVSGAGGSMLKSSEMEPPSFGKRGIAQTAGRASASSSSLYSTDGSLDDFGPDAEMEHVEKLFQLSSQLDAEFAQYQSTNNARDLKLLRHPSNNPLLKPVEMVSVIPDEELWGNTFARITFDSDPIPKSKFLEEDPGYDRMNPAEQRKLRDTLSQELYKSSMIISATQEDESGNVNNIVHYLLPKKKRKLSHQDQASEENGNDDEDQVSRYETIKEYVLDMGGVNPDDPQSSEEHFFMVMHKDQKEARYNSLGRAKIILTSKSTKFAGGEEQDSRVGAITLVKQRDYTESELENRENKRSRELYEQ